MIINYIRKRQEQKIFKLLKQLAKREINNFIITSEYQRELKKKSATKRGKESSQLLRKKIINDKRFQAREEKK